MEIYFNKELVMTKEDNKDFQNSAKRWVFDNDFVDTNRFCNINVEPLNHKLPIVFPNLKN